MTYSAIWKYCTPAHCQAFLQSFQLFPAGWPIEKQQRCLYALAQSPEGHYTSIRIPKRHCGTRHLLAPDPLLKSVQRNMLHHILDGMPASPYATAYRREAGILQNAAPHTGRPCILRLDIADFFTSIQFPMIYGRVFSRTTFPPAVAGLLSALCCYKGYLPQGAPTSPAVSNLVMRSFDFHMGDWCRARAITYTRYCDDMTFSGDFDPYMVERKVDSLLSCMGFTLNRKKTSVRMCCNRQQVTGVVVNAHPQASRDYRRKLRQELHYCAQRGVPAHLAHTLGRVPSAHEELQYLQSLLGRIGFVLQLNPEDAYFLAAREQAKAWLTAKVGVQ